MSPVLTQGVGHSKRAWASAVGRGFGGGMSGLQSGMSFDDASNNWEAGQYAPAVLNGGASLAGAAGVANAGQGLMSSAGRLANRFSPSAGNWLNRAGTVGSRYTGMGMPVAGGLMSFSNAAQRAGEGDVGGTAQGLSQGLSLTGKPLLNTFAKPLAKGVGMGAVRLGLKAIPVLGSAAYAYDAVDNFAKGRWMAGLGNAGGAVADLFGLSPLAMGMAVAGEGANAYSDSNAAVPAPATAAPEAMSNTEMAEYMENVRARLSGAPRGESPTLTRLREIVAGRN